MQAANAPAAAKPPAMLAHTIGRDDLSATILAHGAEPSSLNHDACGEVLWQAGPAWPKHAPVLFPIVGELARGELRHRGRTYPMGRHGFARTRDFTWLETSGAACTLRLTDDDETRAQYPFAFVFDIRYAIEEGAFVATFVVRNPGDEPLPFSVGAHPAFRWPLAEGVAKSAHALVFERDEPEPIRRLENNLLSPEPMPTPIEGRTLALDPSLFDADAIVMDRPRSSCVRYGAPGTPTLEIAWEGFEQLGVWSKAGGDFVCIEPWRGYASPTDFDGDFVDKPGIVVLAPGASASFTWRVSIAR